MRQRFVRQLAVGMLLAGLHITNTSAQAAAPAPAQAIPYPVELAPGASATGARAPQKAAATAGVRLHALDCGRIDLPDLGMFSDTGEYDGVRGTLVSPCFLVVHPSGTLLWDTGLSDQLAGKGPVTVDGGITLQVERSLQAQLKLIGVQKIDYVGFSHFHFDHTGNAGLFRDATWLVSKTDIEAALAHADPFINPDDIRRGRQAKQIALEGDHDVFGDGTVKILKSPGHTAGHQALLIRLAETGPVILSGDLYHTRENRQYQRVPTFNHNRADTLASMNRIETIARNIGARIIVQHDPRDFETLPKAPGYLK
jgi:N-acyl homoserine lactone hydrolase